MPARTRPVRCVYHDRLDMYELLESLWAHGYGRPPSQTDIPLGAVHNNDGFTPMVLAASLGKADVFLQLWEREMETQWSWGSISCRVFPLHFVDDGAQVLARLARTKRAKEASTTAADSTAEEHDLISRTRLPRSRVAACCSS